MSNRIVKKVHVALVVKKGASKYPYFNAEWTEIEFSKTYNSCYYKEITLVKIKGGKRGCNYEDEITGDLYRISQH